MIQLLCDRCGKIIPVDFEPDIFVVKGKRSNLYDSKRPQDLCQSCTNSLMRWLADDYEARPYDPLLHGEMRR